MTEDTLEIRCRGASALVSTLGGALRAASVDGESLIAPGLGNPDAQFRGTVIVPCPNRTKPVSWAIGQAGGTLPPTEGCRGAALHGLVGHREWEVEATQSDAVRLSTTLEPSPGYPFQLFIGVRYSISSVLLRAQFDVINQSDQPSPLGLAWHPYLAMRGPLDDVIVSLAADYALAPDIDGVPQIRQPRPEREVSLARVALDHSFRLAGGGLPVTVTIAEPDREVLMTLGSGWPWVHLYTGDTLPASDKRGSLAVEPMTCPANALHTGTDLIWLAPRRCLQRDLTISQRSVGSSRSRPD